nr:hypothetical protein CFP56_35668 [Quercus suber]
MGIPITGLVRSASSSNGLMMRFESVGRLLGLVLVRVSFDGCWFDYLVPCQLLLGLAPLGNTQALAVTPPWFIGF